MPRQGKKQAKKLARRMGEWKSLSQVDDKNAKGPNAKGTYHHKPGSLKK